MTAPKNTMTNYFDVQDCTYFKPYKVYCIKDYDGKIIYIGCTKKKLSDRMSGHLIDTKMLRPDSNIFYHTFIRGEKLKVEILYDFHSKIFAGITERVLINFYKTHVDSGLFNKKCSLKEEHFTTPFNSIKHY